MKEIQYNNMYSGYSSSSSSSFSLSSVHHACPSGYPLALSFSFLSLFDMLSAAVTCKTWHHAALLPFTHMYRSSPPENETETEYDIPSLPSSHHSHWIVIIINQKQRTALNKLTQDNNNVWKEENHINTMTSSSHSPCHSFILCPSSSRSLLFLKTSRLIVLCEPSSLCGGMDQLLWRLAHFRSLHSLTINMSYITEDKRPNEQSLHAFGRALSHTLQQLVVIYQGEDTIIPTLQLFTYSIPHLIHLREIELRDHMCERVSPSVDLDGLSSLTHLTIFKCGSLTHKQAMQLRRVPSLIQVDVTYMSQQILNWLVDDEPLTEAELAALPPSFSLPIAPPLLQLHNVNQSYLFTTNSTLLSLSRLSHLRFLLLRGMPSPHPDYHPDHMTSDVIAAVIPHWSHLRHLYVEQCDIINMEEMKQHVKETYEEDTEEERIGREVAENQRHNGSWLRTTLCMASQHCHALRKVELRRVYLHPSVFRSFFSSLPLLTHIVLAYVGYLPSYSIFARHVHLLHLSLHYCDCIDGYESLRSLSILPRLNQIKFFDTNQDKRIPKCVPHWLKNKEMERKGETKHDACDTSSSSATHTNCDSSSSVCFFPSLDNVQWRVFGAPK